MNARCSLALMIATAFLAPLGPTALGQNGQTSLLTSSSLDNPCPDNQFPVPQSYAGWTVANAQTDLNGKPGNLNIAISDTGGCDSLREPTASEMSAIIKGPASPCGNPGTCIESGGLVGVILEHPTGISIGLVIATAALTAALVSLGVVALTRPRQSRAS